MVVVGDAATHREKEVKTRYPIEDGIIAGTTTQEGHVINLVSEEGTNVLRRKRDGI